MFIFKTSNIEPKFGFCALYFGETSKTLMIDSHTDRRYCDSVGEIQEKTITELTTDIINTHTF